jgi:hypothetical protein
MIAAVTTRLIAPTNPPIVIIGTTTTTVSTCSLLSIQSIIQMIQVTCLEFSSRCVFCKGYNFGCDILKVISIVTAMEFVAIAIVGVCIVDMNISVDILIAINDGFIMMLLLQMQLLRRLVGLRCSRILTKPRSLRGRRWSLWRHRIMIGLLIAIP